MKILNGLSLSELKDLWKKLNLYKNLEKQLWNRWTAEFKRTLNWTDLLVVEYFSSINEDIAFEKASEVYSKVFKINPNKSDIKFVINDKISGWIKVYLNDSMVDISFSKVENMMLS